MYKTIFNLNFDLGYIMRSFGNKAFIRAQGKSYCVS